VAFFPPPVRDAIARQARPEFRGKIDPLAGLVGDVWVEWFTQLTDDVDSTSARIGGVSLTSQAASIGATDLSGGTISGGLYRLTYYARITQAASTSSSLTVSFGWTDGSVSPTYSGAAITGNTTTTIQSGSIMVKVDANSPITYSTTYASVGATPMQYKLEVVLEQVPTS